MSDALIENPPGFVIATEAKKAAGAHGFRIAEGTEGGWARYASTTAHGTICLARSRNDGPWLLALDHPGVIAEIGIARDPIPGPCLARYQFATLPELYAALNRVYRLALTLPDVPLAAFEDKVRDLPRVTEIERLVVQRIGQDIFRDALMTYWSRRCPLTSITEPELLRASHIVSWADCESDAQRLDVHNGLLLSALWDAAFDKGLVSFADNGSALLSPRLSDQSRAALNATASPAVAGFTPAHRRNLAWHRARHDFI